MDIKTIERDSNGRLPAYAWPGGYPIFYLCTDNGVLCPDCANGDNGSEATTDKDADSTSDKSWTVVAADINWEDGMLTCDHCGKLIGCAYPQD